MASPNATITISKPNILVVEGKEDQRFFGALIGHLRLENIQVFEAEGKTKLRDRLDALVASHGFGDVVSVTVVRDADDDPDAAFQSVRDALQAAGLPRLQRPLVPAGDKPRVIGVTLPGGELRGMLEDLCLKAVAADPATSCVEQFFRCLDQERLPVPCSMSKARVQAFLASREEPGLRLGEAAEKGYWPWDDAAFDWLRALLQQISSQGSLEPS